MNKRQDGGNKTLDISALASLPLRGRHLIEASAGTGKTYNITKLFIRLLLEKQLPVQNVLVMTFTRAATEELRGRIEKEVRFVYENWLNPDLSDPFLDELRKKSIPQAEVMGRLKQALLNMDEAAIFTLHSFCHRVLTQEAFASGLPMELTMEAEADDLMTQAVRDWFRQVNQHDEQLALLQENGWYTPERFISEFGQLVKTDDPLVCLDEADFLQQHNAAQKDLFQTLYTQQKKAVHQSLLLHQSFIFSALVSGKTAKDRLARETEWQVLIDWLEADVLTSCPAEASRFFSGTRYPKKDNATKQELVSLFQPVKELVKSHKDKTKQWLRKREDYLQSLPALVLVKQGIYAIRKRFGLAKEKTAQMDFNDLIDHLSERLAEDKSARLVNLLRNQYPVALVDEFQDTDSKQYTILDALYPQSDSWHALFMIGDPKQAIYSFRGGDIYAYLKARRQADFRWHMATNWRSLGAVVEGYNRLFYGGPLDGEPTSEVFGNGISYERIGYSPHAAAVARPLKDSREQFGAVNFIWLPEIARPTGAKGEPVKNDWLAGLTRWCVSEIDHLLNHVYLGKQRVQEKDIAVLVRTGKEAIVIKEALRRSGYASVYLSDKTNVFASNEAKELLTLLLGILECDNDRLLVAAISTRIWGGDATMLAELTQEQGELAWTAARARAYSLRECWLQQGCMNMLLSLIHSCCCPEPADHERTLTNLLHLAELLQQAARQYRQPQQLFKWYRDQCDNPALAAEVEQRLESEGNLIRIVTQHKSKGLEYPIVFIPYATTYRDPTKNGNALVSYSKYHDRQTGDLVYQLGATEDALAAMRDELHAESIRLFYVAVTRASHRCYIGLAPIDENSVRSGVGLVLKVANNTQWQTQLEALIPSSGVNFAGSSMANPSNKLISITSETALPKKIKTDATQAESLTPASFTTCLDDQWQLASYSMMKKSAYQQRAERQDQKDRDEWSDKVPAENAPTVLAVSGQAVPLRFSLKKGSETGDLLHDILEHIDFANPDWLVIQPLLNRFDPEADYQDRLIEWIQEVLLAEIPVIGYLDQTMRLSDLHWEHTLREAEFYFSMDNVNLDQLERLLMAHRGTRQRIQLSSSSLSQGSIKLNGMMHGFIDLIFEFRGKYYVADYKSNHLGDRYEDYQVQALAENVYQQFYDLQYLIYSLALHRYLKNTLTEEYSPETHFGGVYYLYLRGITPVHSEHSGIYRRAITVDELMQLDKLFGTGTEHCIGDDMA